MRIVGHEIFFSESAKKGIERYIFPKDESGRWEERRFGLKHDFLKITLKTTEKYIIYP